ncbi:MAG: phosphoribosylanthranilate isomerase [Candidatus Nitricoxidivorans perseverans]|uniref:N-(5'-phosphoribosyl)anthranilate isomerase n=1 Tax=Candidatus Nitricoxidivorans perseverans TaxID=2975601 RepID=A0AA49FN63_9PROT|nr:MAG: phosphoribosylanthranilate isomerase [Candidatus Nitricoxidivorans perseverans]
MTRTRIKICGITREEDLDAALAAGADAIGFVFYPKSPRALTPLRAARLAERVPPFVSRVGLFVNEDDDTVAATLEIVPLEVLQFHGDEDAVYCAEFGKPWIKAARVRPGLDLVEFARSFSSAQALLLDAHVEGYGGAGQTFDWSLIPNELPLPMILSGGLTAENVGDAIRRLHPWAVDVSSGVESAKGIKDAARIAAFVAAVKSADA